MIKKVPEGEMVEEDLELLVGMIERANPKKVLEIGVSAGGTTSVLFDVLPKDSILYSVDLAKRLYYDPSKKTGHIAERLYNAQSHPQWRKYFGVDVSYCIEDIGGDIDFVILDTTHAMPGEFLSFLSVLPFLKDGATLVLHDIGLHLIHKLDKDNKQLADTNLYCTALLFNAVSSGEKIVSRSQTGSTLIIPNCGALIIDKKRAMDDIFMVFNMLFMDWSYIPEPALLSRTGQLIADHYPIFCFFLYTQALEYNLKIHGKADVLAAMER